MHLFNSKLYPLFAILGGVALFAAIIFVLYNETRLERGNAVLYIPSSTLESTIESLQKGGYEIGKIDHFVMRFVNTPSKGWYKIDERTTGRFFFFKNLHRMRAETIEVVLFAGDTADETLTHLANDMLVNKEELSKYYNECAHFKEGEMLAGRYDVARGVDEQTLIRYLIDLSYDKIDLFAKEHFGANYSRTKLHNSLIIASLIQKESNHPQEMPKISAVIHNRLKKGIRLQLDGSLNYGKFSHVVVTPERIRSDKSLYNTYKRKGLPPEPLSTFTIEALQAAVEPDKSDHLYFMLNEQGKHDFAATYKEHLSNIKEFRAYCKERDDEKALIEAEAKAKEENRSNADKDTNTSAIEYNAAKAISPDINITRIIDETGNEKSKVIIDIQKN